MIGLLKSAKHVSDAARRATQLLEGLLGELERDTVAGFVLRLGTLAAEEECPAPPAYGPLAGQKRKLESLDDPDPFRRVVKKLLLEASAKNGSVSQPSPSSSTGLQQQSPTLFHQPGSQDNRMMPTMGGYAHQPMRPLPFAPDLDLFMEGSRLHSHFSKPTPVFASEEPIDSTSADLSHLFVDDILSNLFTTDPLGGPDMGFGGNSGW
jgi:hypothetical protein